VGSKLWVSKGLGGTIYTTTVSGEGALFAMTSGPGGGSGIAVKPGGNGDVTESNGSGAKSGSRVGIGSGVIYDGHLYTIGQDGIAACMNPQGWKHDLGGAF
jgi:hypothetical protein